MGKVIIIEPGEHIPGVYAIEIDVEYTYCDTCGSFSIEMKYHLRTPLETFASRIWIWISLFAIGWLVIAVLLTKSWFISCLVGIVGLILGLIGSPKSYLKCRKCGNEQITNENTRHFRGDDRSIIDVSDDLVIKRPLGATIY